MLAPPHRNPRRIRSKHCGRSLRESPAATLGRRGTGPARAAAFGIGESNLARRREFVRLSEDDRQLLLSMLDWATEAAPEIAHDFYEWQFSFRPTLAFFEEFRARTCRLRRCESTWRWPKRATSSGCSRARSRLGFGLFRPAGYRLRTRPDQPAVQVVHRLLHGIAAAVQATAEARYQERRIRGEG